MDGPPRALKRGDCPFVPSQYGTYPSQGLIWGPMGASGSPQRPTISVFLGSMRQLLPLGPLCLLAVPASTETFNLLTPLAITFCP